MIERKRQRERDRESREKARRKRKSATWARVRFDTRFCASKRSNLKRIDKRRKREREKEVYIVRVASRVKLRRSRFRLPSLETHALLLPRDFFHTSQISARMTRDVFASIGAMKKLIKILREDRVRMKVSMRMGQNCWSLSGSWIDARRISRVSIDIYKVSCHSHARQQQTIHLYVQHRNRITRKGEAIDHLLSATFNSPRSYQQGQRNEGVSMIARDTIVRTTALSS